MKWDFNDMESIDRLSQIIKKLRAPDGCPWDREQTHDSIRGHLVEECSEFLDAVDEKNYPNMCEELGDMLMHIMLHAEMASEEGRFDFGDVVREISEKLVRRHPHVFSGAKAATSSDVLGIWKDVKSREKKTRPKSDNFWLNMPKELSALRKAYEAAKAVDPAAEAKAAESVSEGGAEAFGKRLYDIVAECAENRVEPEGALRDYLKVLRRNSDPDFKG